MPQRKDFRFVTRAAHKGVVWRRRSIVAQAEDLSSVTIRVLGTLVERASNRHIQGAVGGKHNARSRGPTVINRIRDEDVSNIRENRSIPTAARESGRDLVPYRFGVRQVD